MNDPIPSAREGLEDKLCAHIERLNDARLAEHHRMRCLHVRGADGHCVEDGQLCPCRSMQIIDGEAVA